MTSADETGAHVGLQQLFSICQRHGLLGAWPVVLHHAALLAHRIPCSMAPLGPAEHRRSWTGQPSQNSLGSTCDNLIDPITTPCAGERIVDIAAGAHHSLAVSDAGRIFAWGRAGRLGHAPLPGSRARDEFAPRLVQPHSRVSGFSTCMPADCTAQGAERGRPVVCAAQRVCAQCARDVCRHVWMSERGCGACRVFLSWSKG